MSEALRLSVVVAVHNGSASLDDTLASIIASDMPREMYEVVVVDDASTDESEEVAARFADVLVRLKGVPSGLAYARNRGAELARGEILAFVEAGVIVRPGTLSTLVEVLHENPGISAVCASNDDATVSANLMTQYWNLLMRVGAERHGGMGGNFAAGCGVIRRHLFMSVGMYDEWRFQHTGLEDLELGQRMHANGHDVLFSPELKVTHSRRWSLFGVLSEAWRRSLTIARSVGYRQTRASAHAEVVHTLNDALATVVALVGLLAVSAFMVPRASWPMVVVAVWVVLLAGNHAVHGLFARRRGVLFSAVTAPIHVAVQCAAGMGLCAGWALQHIVGDRAPDATTQAYAEMGLDMWPPVRRQR